MTWVKFNNFLKMNLGDNWAFTNSICSNVKRDSQYQAEFVLHWAAHLEHLKSIFLKDYLVRAPIKPTMVRYFWKDLKPSVLAE